MKNLIINADDFGLTREVNKGIIEGYRNGILTSASIMANMPAFEDAIRLIKENPRLGIGVHLNILIGRPLISPGKVPALLDTGGYFNRKSFIKILFGCINLQEIEMEFRAQIKKVFDTGIDITHLDSHKHIHCCPAIFKIVIKLAIEFGIKRIRYINERVVSPRERGLFGNFYSAFFNTRYYQLNLFNYLCRLTDADFKKNGLMHPDYFFGILYSGSQNLRTYKSIIRSLRDGVTEIMSHPGYSSVELERISFLNKCREEETKLLLSAELKNIIGQENIRLINYRDLN